MKILYYLTMVFLFPVFWGCFQTTDTRMLQKDALHEGYTVNSPSKVFLSDASMIVFDTGFSVINKHVTGNGTMYKMINTLGINSKYSIHLDSVMAVTTHDSKLDGTRATAHVLLYLFGIPTTVSAVYCLTCPKCCFGSCPTIYSYDGVKYNFETELFSYSIAKPMEDSDLDVLYQEAPENGIYNLKITNEALETHYINRMGLVTANHPSGTKLLPSSKGEYIVVREPLPPLEAKNIEGKDVTSLVNSPDGNYYRSGSDMVKNLKSGVYYDWLDITTKVPENAYRVKIILRYRNTLLSTILFYEVVLGSQGIDAINWINEMNNNERYASQFNFVYQTFSGIQISSDNNGKHIRKGSFADAGPLNWKYSAEKFDINGEHELKIRLQFIPDNFMIDYIAFDFSDGSDDAVTFEEIDPFEIKDGEGNQRNECAGLLKNADDDYLVTNPGDSYNIQYRYTKRYDCEQTFFVTSRGYYNEWIRGSWIKNNRLTNNGYTFNLLDIKGTLNCLADNWIYGRDEIEREFFKNRIPVRGAK